MFYPQLVPCPQSLLSHVGLVCFIALQKVYTPHTGIRLALASFDISDFYENYFYVGKKVRKCICDVKNYYLHFKQPSSSLLPEVSFLYLGASPAQVSSSATGPMLNLELTLTCSV